MSRGRTAVIVCLALAAGGCLDAPPGGLTVAECPEPGTLPPDPLLGDVVTFTFDQDVTATEVVHDQSGNRLDGALEGAAIVEVGRHGRSAEWQGPDTAIAEVPASPRFDLGGVLTVELWVWRSRTGVHEGLVSLYDPETDRAEIALEILDDDGLGFTTAAAPCQDPVPVTVAAPPSAVTVPMGEWVHLAVTWDGADVRFYRGGALVHSAALAVTPCRIDRPLYIGATGPGHLGFEGTVDDVKISSYVKSEQQIELSMDHDPTLAAPRCGDRLVEPGEDCEPPAACCDPATCRFGDPECGCPGSCLQGACLVEAGRRAEDGLVALYDFDEGEGRVIGDRAGSGVQLGVFGTDFAWQPGSLILGGSDAAAVSAGEATELVLPSRASGEVTFEAWVTPAAGTGDDLFIAGLGRGAGCVSLALVQNQDSAVGVVGTSLSEADGEPHIDASGALAANRLSHLVVTHAADGWRRLYVDGRLRSESQVTGDLSSWQPDDYLTVGNAITGVAAGCEGGESAPWAGAIHLLALYDRALATAEVAGNFAAGHEAGSAGLR